jgi:hypothetical protein
MSIFTSFRVGLMLYWLCSKSIEHSLPLSTRPSQLRSPQVRHDDDTTKYVQEHTFSDLKWANYFLKLIYDN